MNKLPAITGSIFNAVAMRLLVFSCFILFSLPATGQVFLRPFDNAASLSLGGAVSAYPGLETGLSNEALAGFGEKTAVFLGSAIPYGIAGWRTARLQGVVKIDRNSGAGLDFSHSGIDAYGEQRFSFSYGRRLGEKFYLGGSVDLLHIAAQEYGSATGVNAGIGVLSNPLPRLWLAARIRNPFPQKTGPDRPSGALILGAAWKPSPILVLLAETEKILERPAQIKAGIEYHPAEALFFRAGMRAGAAARVGFGAGLRLKNGWGVDAGSEWHPSLGLTPAAMIVWRKP